MDITLAISLAAIFVLLLSVTGLLLNHSSLTLNTDHFYFARAVLKHAVDSGLDPVSLLRKNRISPRLLLEEDARISIERFADLQVSTMLAMAHDRVGDGREA